jgi:hypothetical protein
LILY